jgi:hypothetical protein
MKRIHATSLMIGAILLSNIVFSAEPLFERAEFVKFESSAFAYPPSPFKVKRGSTSGLKLKTKRNPVSL